MPRKQAIKATDILDYFNTAALEAATLVLELSTAKVRERKAAAGKSTSAETTAAGTKAATGGGQRRRTNAGAGQAAVTGPAATPLPGMTPVTGGGTQV